MNSNSSDDEWSGSGSGSSDVGVGAEVHYVIGGLLLVVGTAGALGNALVLFVFTRFRRLRGPFSAFIVNLAAADFCTSLLHGMAVYSSFRQRWAFGHLGCVVYGGGVGHFGLLSIVTLAAIAVERYWVITAKPLSGSRKMTKYCARKMCVLAWIYTFALSLPPLFGWSRYVLEGFSTSCSWDYTTRSPSNRAYYVYLVTFGFLVPVSIITYCYAFIMVAILAHSREMRDVKANGGGKPRRPAVPQAPSSSTVRTAEIIFVLVLLFLLSWTPYAVVTMIGQFGDPAWMSSWLAALPAIFAKASVVYNPIVYGLSHPHFRSSVKQYLSACTTGVSSSTGLRVGARRAAAPRAACSSPPLTASAPRAHRAHFRCFQSPVERSYYSEPDTRELSAARAQPLVSLRFPKGRGQVALRASASIWTPSCQNQNFNSLGITSEGMVTTGSQTSCQAHNLYEISAIPKFSSRWTAVSKK